MGLTALRKEAFDLIRDEMRYIGLMFIIALIIFKIAFFKDSISNLLRITFSLFWLFALPGYFLMLYWNEKLEFAERFIIGIALSAAIIGISSYYIGLAGLNIKYHTVLLPLILMLAGAIINFRK